MEKLLGNTIEQKELRFRLNTLRLFHFKLLKEKYHDIHYIPLSQFLLDESLESKIDIALFKNGIEIFYKNIETLTDNYNFLPLDRVFVGLHKNNENVDKGFNEFGGYYSKYQTYYHLEQISVTSLLGCYIGKEYNKALTTLELLRSYFHDTIHFNTFRSYKLRFNYSNEKIDINSIHRFQYGFNFRHENGYSFSNPDEKVATTTRNLGIIMEGITDDFSKASVRNILEEQNILLSDLTYFENSIFNEITSSNFKEVYAAGTPFSKDEINYLKKINYSYKSVYSLYYAFLNEFSLSSKQKFREFLFSSMLTGDFIGIRDYFNRYTKDAKGFDKLFKSPHY